MSEYHYPSAELAELVQGDLFRQRSQHVFELGCLAIKALLFMNLGGLLFGAVVSSGYSILFLVGVVFAMLTLSISYILLQLADDYFIHGFAENPAVAIQGMPALVVQAVPCVASFLFFILGVISLLNQL